jgi:uncharacterized 2Fe-2S/4Fe-4S cluster protein (DUF4445 family)
MIKDVVFLPMGMRAPADPERTLLELAQAAGVPMVGTCGGKGQCGKCRVLPMGDTNPATGLEVGLLGQAAGQGLRLACHLRMANGGRVWLPVESRLEGQKILTAGQGGVLDLDPVVRLHRLMVAPAALDDPVAAGPRLLRALNKRAPAVDRLGLGVLRDLPKSLAQSHGNVTVIVRKGRKVTGVVPGHQGRCLGLAVDLGTTTVVVYLLDLHTGQSLAVRAAMNPQVTIGDDVVTRLTYCNQSHKQASTLSSLATECVNHLAREACAEAGVLPSEIYECVMVGNTAMHHLFLGLDPQGLAVAPYSPVESSGLKVRARDVGLALAPEARLYWLPVKAGFVGADTVALTLALDAAALEQPTLILDLGTNGEMVLASGGRLMCCSAAAGPAFEGGHIGQGMRGAPGAVERVAINGRGLKTVLKVIGGIPPLGMCGSGLVSAVAALLSAGVLTSAGAFKENLPGVRPGSKGLEFVLAEAESTGKGQDLVLTSADVAELQLAKAAIRAGAELLMATMGVPRLERVLLAGAFGNYMEPAEALAIGLFPTIALSNIVGVGNAAGTGALMALASEKARCRAESLASSMEYLELSGHPLFRDYFLDHLPFPLPIAEGSSKDAVCA